MSGGGFGAGFTLAKPDKYGVMRRFKLADGKVRSARFLYRVKLIYPIRLG